MFIVKLGKSFDGGEIRLFEQKVGDQIKGSPFVQPSRFGTSHDRQDVPSINLHRQTLRTDCSLELALRRSAPNHQRIVDMRKHSGCRVCLGVGKRRAFCGTPNSPSESSFGKPKETEQPVTLVPAAKSSGIARQSCRRTGITVTDFVAAISRKVVVHLGMHYGRSEA